jgi:hypothetical protein
VVLMSPNELATRSPEELVDTTATVCAKFGGKKRGEEWGEKREREREGGECRPISGSGALIHFILCALERRSIKAGKSHRDSTRERKGGGG